MGRLACLGIEQANSDYSMWSMGRNRQQLRYDKLLLTIYLSRELRYPQQKLNWGGARR